VFLATDVSNQADSEQRLSPDERRLATQRGSCIGRLPFARSNFWSACVYSVGVVDAGRGRVARIQQTEGDSSSQFRPWMPLKEHRRAAGSLSCVHTMGALRCTEINYSEGVLGVFVPGKRTGDAFCRRSGREPSGRSTTGRGVPKRAQTQRRGASAGR